jgi:hypothetical protein
VVRSREGVGGAERDHGGGEQASKPPRPPRRLRVASGNADSL